MKFLDLLARTSFQARIPWRFIPCAFLVCCLVATTRTTAIARDEEPSEQPLETRVYSVGDLVMSVPDYDYRGAEAPVLNFGPMQRGTSAGGSRGGMGGMGGGFFNVPVPAQAQMGGAGTAGASASASFVGSADHARPLKRNFDQLVNALTTVIDPDTWEQMGGAGAVVTFKDKLIITQTANTHAKIEKLLDALRADGAGAQTVTVRAHWLVLNSKQLATLESSSLERATLAKIAIDTTGYQGQITCFDGQTVHLLAGGARSKVVGAIPVVGGEGVGYQPVIAAPQEGVVLEVTPQLIEGGKRVILDVRTSVVKADAAGPQAPFLGTPASAGTGEESGSATTTLYLDRVGLALQQLMTTVRAPIGRPMLIGGLTRDPNGGDEKAADAPQLYLFLEATLPVGS